MNGHVSSTARARAVREYKKSIRQLHKFAILLDTGIFAEGRDQEGAMLFSSQRQAESELRFRSRQNATVIPVTITYQALTATK